MHFFKVFFFLVLLSLSTTKVLALDMPKADASGRVLTLNNMGTMHPFIDPVTLKFLELCETHHGSKVLEIGAAYGYASEAALVRGAKVWVNDLSQNHLDLFQQNIKDKELLKNATMMVGNFPDDIKLENNFFDAILTVRVLHFFDPEKLNQAAKSMHLALKSGGKVYVVNDSPYMKNWAGFIPVYEQKKREGDPYPGYFTNLSDYNKDMAKRLPAALHFLDPEVLTRVFTNAGFKVEFSEFLNRTDYPDSNRLDGRESVGLIATKP